MAFIQNQAGSQQCGSYHYWARNASVHPIEALIVSEVAMMFSGFLPSSGVCDMAFFHKIACDILSATVLQSNTIFRVLIRQVRVLEFFMVATGRLIDKNP